MRVFTVETVMETEVDALEEKRVELLHEFTSDGIVTLLEDAKGPVFLEIEFYSRQCTFPMLVLLLENLASNQRFASDDRKKNAGIKPMTAATAARVISNRRKSSNRDIANSPCTQRLVSSINLIWDMTASLPIELGPCKETPELLNSLVMFKVMLGELKPIADQDKYLAMVNVTSGTSTELLAVATMCHHYRKYLFFYYCKNLVNICWVFLYVF
jgi:hypothetical protein